MGVVISKPAINIREQLTELKAQQGYEEQQFHFDNLVTNGTFDTDTDWNKGTGWTISGGEAVATSATSSNLTSSSATLTIGKTYLYIFTVTSISSGAVNIGNFGNDGTSRTAVGTYSELLVAAETTPRLRAQSSFTGTIDNFYVFETDGTDVIHRLPKGWKPLHVFEDGALQREGSAYDYTVEYDGFNYIVKETVAPVAPYSTTVIGVRA